MQNYKLEAQQRLKSIYNPRKKMKGNSMFPKIHRLQVSPIQSKPIIKGLNKKYRNNDNIFKKQDEKPSNRNLKLQEQKIIHSKQYEQLQLIIAECRRKHLEELSIIQMKQKETAKLIQNSKKQSYNSKLCMWELKNQVLELEQLLKDQEEEYNRLCYDLGYVQNQNGELQYAQQQELQGQMNNNDEGYQYEQQNANQQQEQQNTNQLFQQQNTNQQFQHTNQLSEQQYANQAFQQQINQNQLSEQQNYEQQNLQNQLQDKYHSINPFHSNKKAQINDQIITSKVQNQEYFSCYNSQNINYQNIKANNERVNHKIEQKRNLMAQF